MRATDAFRFFSRVSNMAPLGLYGQSGQIRRGARDIGKILQSATQLCTQGLVARFAKVLEYLPKEDRLLVRAGVGWKPGAIDNTTLGADLKSPAPGHFQRGLIAAFPLNGTIPGSRFARHFYFLSYHIPNPDFLHDHHRSNGDRCCKNNTQPSKQQAKYDYCK